MLDHVECCHEVPQSSSVSIVGVMNVDVEVATDDDWAGMGDEDLQHGCQLVTERR